ncbi:hypothetical protein ZWY2020_014228 [Hordeum vulgare]|nr:hypothetical protein ZWY2020_014228 [Hordeum vulgare]
MVFEDQSSGDQSSLPYIHSSNSSTEWIYQVPASVEDPDYHGLELDTMVFCEKHGKASMRHVAFEGTYTGRRFLACAEPISDNCGFVEWVDQEWPIPMRNALLKLWTMFEDTKNARLTDNLESALTIYHLKEEKNNVDANYEKSEIVADLKGQMAKKDEDHKNLNDKYELLVNLTRAQAAVIQNLKLKHMKEKQVHYEAMEKLELKNAELTKCEEKLTQEKLELKFHIVDLLKGKEVQSEERAQLELQIAELMKGEEELKLKLKCILAILQK